MRELFSWIMGGVIVVISAYWLIQFGKFTSYSFFYEDMVIETIKETVKPEYLK